MNTELSPRAARLLLRIGQSIRPWPRGAARIAHSPAPMHWIDGPQIGLCRLASRYWQKSLILNDRYGSEPDIGLILAVPRQEIASLGRKAATGQEQSFADPTELPRPRVRERIGGW